MSVAALNTKRRLKSRRSSMGLLFLYIGGIAFLFVIAITIMFLTAKGHTKEKYTGYYEGVYTGYGYPEYSGYTAELLNEGEYTVYPQEGYTEINTPVDSTVKEASTVNPTVNHNPTPAVNPKVVANTCFLIKTRSMIHSSAYSFSQKVQRLIYLFSEIESAPSQIVTEILEYLNSPPPGKARREFFIKNIKNVSAFKITVNNTSRILKLASPAQNFETEVTLAKYPLNNIATAIEIYRFKGRTWYTTEVLDIDIHHQAVQDGIRTGIASRIIEDLTMGIRELYSLKILPTPLTYENVRGVLFDVNGNKYTQFKLVDIAGIKYDKMEDKLPAAARQSLEQMALFFIDLNNRIMQAHGKESVGKMYGDRQKYEIISDDAQLCDMILVCLGQVENPPKNILELFNHPFFSKEHPKNDVFGRRKYLVSAGSERVMLPFY